MAKYILIYVSMSIEHSTKFKR